ncbi:MAG TPA: hypothetical protein DD638_13030, partial [Pasteurellaceae bacterium]|nr:hypothetical protein [Pasteurellaceae bacterium]
EGRPEAMKIDYPKHPLTFADTTDKPNILLITVSGLRHDVITADNMPELTRFATDSTQFINHYSGGNNNNAGITGLFYGLNANYVDSLLNNKTPSVLIRKLQKDGYYFALFSATHFKDSIFRQALFPEYKLTKNKPGNQSAVENWLKWTSSAAPNQPWFSYLNLDLEGSVRERKLTTLELEKAYYNEHLSQLDSLLGKIFARLEEYGWLQNTMIIITAEHGYAFQLSGDELNNYFARDEIQVPMIVRWRGLPTKIESKLSSHIDLLPALMNEVFKVQNPIIDYAQGSDLFSDKRAAEWVFAANYRWNVIITSDGTQYHIDKKGNYQKYDRTYQKVSSDRLPLGLFLEAFNRDRSFLDK